MTTNKNERVEKYLLNKMTESEKSAFQFELMQNKTLQQEVRSMRTLQKTLIAESRRGAGKQTSSSSYWKWLLPLLLLPALFFLWNKSDVETVPTENPKEETVPPITSEEEVNTDDHQSKELQNPVDKKEEKAVKKQEQKVEEKDSPIPKFQETQQPIAMANYDPNALLEALIDNNTRGSETSFTIDRRQADVSLVREGASTDFHISGKVESEEDLSESTFNLYIFNNDIETYRNFLPQYTKELTLEKKEDAYLFEVQISIVLKPGLYYYLIPIFHHLIL